MDAFVVLCYRRFRGCTLGNDLFFPSFFPMDFYGFAYGSSFLPRGLAWGLHRSKAPAPCFFFLVHPIFYYAEGEIANTLSSVQRSSFSHDRFLRRLGAVMDIACRPILSLLIPRLTLNLRFTVIGCGFAFFPRIRVLPEASFPNERLPPSLIHLRSLPSFLRSNLTPLFGIIASLLAFLRCPYG